MPSLMPEMPGTKEAYGLSLIHNDFTVKIPPKALEKYNIVNGDILFLLTTHKGEGGFALIKKVNARKSVFNKFLNKIDDFNSVMWFNKKAYVTTQYTNDKIVLTKEILNAFDLKIGNKLMSVKSTTITLSFTPKDIWSKKFLMRGLDEASDNIEKLEIF